MAITTTRNNLTRAAVLWALVGVLLIAASMRLIGTTDQSLWLDEGFTYNVIARAGDGLGEMFAEIRRDTHPPLYFTLLLIWTRLTGDSVLALRLFSGLTAMLSVAVAYRLGLRLGAGQLGAVVAALLLALWDADIFLAQETRMYALRTLLACVSMWAYLRWLAVPSGRRVAPWVLANAALMYTQYLSGWIPLVQGLHALLFLRGRRLVGAIGALAGAGVLFAPWFIGVTLNQAATPPDYEMLNAPPSTWGTLIDLNRMYFGAQWALLFGLIGAALWRWKWQRGVVLAALWLAVPVVGTFAANTQFPLLMPRNLSLITPAAALLVALGWAVFGQGARVLLLVGIVGYMGTTVDYYRPKPPWDELGAAMAQYALPEDVALMEVGNGGYPLRYYLDHLMPTNVPVMNLPRARSDHPATYYEELSETLESTDTVWLAHWSPEVEIFRLLDEAGFVQTGTTTVDHVGNALDAHRYDRPPADDVATYENGMRLRLAEARPDGVNLLWAVDGTIDADYSVSAFLLDSSGVLVAQEDITQPTSTWEAGETIFTPHTFEVAALPSGTYTLAVKVYRWQDSTVIPTVTGAEFAEITTFETP